MSRVEGETQSAKEAERAAKEADKRSREAKLAQTDRQTFGRMLESQKGAKEQALQQGAQQAREQAAEGQKKTGEQAKAALMARHGVAQQGRFMEAAKTFQGSLEQAQQKTQASDQGRVERRDTGKQKDRVEHEDRKEVQERRAESKKDRETELARAEARDAARPNAAIGSDGGNKGDGQPQGDDGSAAAAAAIKKAAQQPTAAKGPQAAREVKQIPPELLEKLVSTVYLAVTEKGLKEFQIELKDGPLKGAFLKISADNGKVALAFSGLGAQEKALLESSKGDLMRRLEKKGLSLGRLEVR
jgi:hypothetical protein